MWCGSNLSGVIQGSTMSVPDGSMCLAIASTACRRPSVVPA